MRIQEACSQEQFETIHATLDKARRTSKTVTISRDALAALLIDHSSLHAAISSVNEASHAE